MMFKRGVVVFLLAAAGGILGASPCLLVVWEKARGRAAPADALPVSDATVLAAVHETQEQIVARAWRDVKQADATLLMKNWDDVPAPVHFPPDAAVPWLAGMSPEERASIVYLCLPRDKGGSACIPVDGAGGRDGIPRLFAGGGSYYLVGWDVLNSSGGRVCQDPHVNESQREIRCH